MQSWMLNVLTMNLKYKFVKSEAKFERGGGLYM